jgi:predicted small secreted protein
MTRSLSRAPAPKRAWRQIIAIMVAASLVGPGCSTIRSGVGNDIERADDLGLPLPGAIPVAQPASQPVGTASTAAIVTLAGTSLPNAVGSSSETERDAFVEQWMARSDYLCRQFKDKIIRSARDSKLGTDVLTTLLAGLATIFTPVSTIRPLAGAATIVSGAGAAVETDVFAQQAGEVIASAIQTARENQANQIEHNLSFNTKVYNIYRAQRDVVEYHNMCSLETALNQIRSSLKATSPDGGRTPPAAQGSQTPGGIPATQVPRLSNPPLATNFTIAKVGDAVPAPPPRPPTTLQPSGRNDFERSLSPARVSQMQSALCVTPDGVIGRSTEKAAQSYLAGRDLASNPDGTIDATSARLIQKAIDEVGSCATQGYLNAFEVGRYGASPDPKAAIQELQAKLKALAPEVAVPTDGTFLPRGPGNKTREAIRRVRAANGLPEADGAVDAELLKLNGLAAR